MPAYRNIRLCTKDCLCLYVCPTGASDTENSIIDASKCIGCMACVNACPSKAISMVPDSYPAQQPKTAAVVAALRALSLSKVRQQLTANNVAAATDSAVTRQFASAIAKSNQLMAEDLLRESGFMLPQSDEVRELLESLLDNAPADLPVEAVRLLLSKLY